MTAPPPIHPSPMSPHEILRAKAVAAQAAEVERNPLPPGISCLRCGCTRWRVVKTRTTPGRIVRWRRCLRCRHVRHTFEQ